MPKNRRVVVVAMLVALFSASTAEAFFAVPFPFFTPISDCGTVGTVPSSLGGDCQAWFADSGGVYTVAGLEDFDDGDRVFVDGLVCNVCLTTCFAGAIFNAVVIPACGK